MDTLVLQEAWSYGGITSVLSGFPLLPSFIIVSLMRIAFGLAVDGLIACNTTFSTITEKRPFNTNGRRYVNGFSYQTYPKWLRNRCLPDGSFEVDIVNCFPTIIANFCRDKHGCKVLSEYIDRREVYLKSISEILGVDRDFCKRLILVIIQGRNWRYFLAKKLSIRPERVRACKFLDDLQCEMEIIRDTILKSSEAVGIKDEFKRNGVFEGWEARKIINMTFSIFLERKERQIMDCMIEFLRGSFNIQPGTLMHDGFIASFESTISGEFIQVSRSDQQNIPVETVREAVEAHITNKLGVNIKINIKPCSKPESADVIPQPFTCRSTFKNIKYVSDDFVRVPVFNDKERCISIKAGMRGGKTTALVNFLRQTVSSNERVLLTTCRIQQALSLVGGLSHIDIASGSRVSDIIACDGIPFKVFLYRDKEEVLSSSSPGIYICQWESLHCLVEASTNTYKSFDYIINDEIRSTLSQACVGITNKEFLRLNMHIFRDICAKTKCLMFDADLLIDGMVERFCLKQSGGIWAEDEIRVEVYTKQSMPRKFTITDDRLNFIEVLLASISGARESRERDGKSVPVFIACRSKRSLFDLLALITGKTNPEFLENGVAYFSSSSTTAQMSIWENVDNFITENAVDVIITTSKVTVCADMKSKVTGCFIMGNSMGGCHARDLFQTIGRAREPMDDNITILVNTPGTFKFVDPDFEDIKASMLEDAVIRKRYLNVIETEVGFDIEDDHKFNRLVVQRSPDWMINLACDTELEIQSNRYINFHSSLIRIASYKGWAVQFKGKPEVNDDDEDEDDRLKIAHKIAGDELEAQETVLLEELKCLPIEELVTLSKSKNEDGPAKERAFVSSFLIRFPTFISHVTLDHKKYYLKNRGVFDRCKLLVMDDSKLSAVDLCKILKSVNKGIMERTPIMKTAITLLGGMLVNIIGLNFHESFTDAPLEEKQEKNRVIEEYDIGKSELAERFEDIQTCSSEILRNLGMVRTKRVTVCKDHGLGACRLLDKVLRLFGRKLESCKDRSPGNRDNRAYRIVKDELFDMMFAHYDAKEYPEHVRAGVKSMLRYAKRENPHLLKRKQVDCIVNSSTKTDSKTTNKSKQPVRQLPTYSEISEKRRMQQILISGEDEKHP